MKMRDYASLSLINLDTLFKAQSRVDLWKCYESPASDKSAPCDVELAAMKDMKKRDTPLTLTQRELQQSLGRNMQYVFMHFELENFHDGETRIFQELVIFHEDVAVQISGEVIGGVLYLAEEACVSDDWHLWNQMGSVAAYDQIESIVFPVLE